MNFNTGGLAGQFNCTNYSQGQLVSYQQTNSVGTVPSTSNTNNSLTNSSLAAMQQFAQQGGNYGSFPTAFNNANFVQKDMENLKNQNSDYMLELEKHKSVVSDYQYQLMTAQRKGNSQQEQINGMIKEKIELERQLKDAQAKIQQFQQQFNDPYQSRCRDTEEDVSLKCDDCHFEVKSNVALFIHKLNHHMENTIPRHLQLSPRSFTTLPDDNVRFKYKCFYCTIDRDREYAKHEIYCHIYQYHTFDQPFKCRLCFLYFTSQTYLTEHMNEKHSTSSGKSVGGKIKGKGGTKIQQQQTTASNVRDGNSNCQFIPNAYTQNKKARMDNSNEATDINELFKQLVGETLGEDHTTNNMSHGNHSIGMHTLHHNFYNNNVLTQQQQQILELNTNLLSTPIPHSSMKHHQAQQHHQTPPHLMPSARSSAHQPPKLTEQQLAEQQKRDSEIQTIMNKLDGEEGLNCKYPGCKFVATNKNHLKFHISAHLMSKYKCPYCTFVGNRIIEIKRHILKSTKHTDQHVFLCQECDYATDCEKTFRDHYTRIHNTNADVTQVIERMFLNESNKVGQNMLSAVHGNSSGSVVIADNDTSTNNNNSSVNHLTTVSTQN